MKLLLKIILIVFTLLVIISGALFAAYLWVPWHPFAEKQIARVLEAKGLTGVEVTLEEVDTKHLLISKLKFSKNNIPVAVKDVRFDAVKYDRDKLIRGDFEGIEGIWTVGQAGALWQGGLVRANNIVFKAGEPFTVNLVAQKIPLNPILKLSLSKEAYGSGEVSGTLPITIFPSGDFTIGSGRLSAISDGKIIIPQEFIAGKNAQLDQVRTALSDFHYTDLTLTTQNGNGEKFSIRLDIAGSNPDAFDGRVVKLHVNFTGDLLELLKQNVIPIVKPETLLEQKQ